MLVLRADKENITVTHKGESMVIASYKKDGHIYLVFDAPKTFEIYRANAKTKKANNNEQA